MERVIELQHPDDFIVFAGAAKKAYPKYRIYGFFSYWGTTGGVDICLEHAFLLNPWTNKIFDVFGVRDLDAADGRFCKESISCEHIQTNFMREVHYAELFQWKQPEPCRSYVDFRSKVRAFNEEVERMTASILQRCGKNIVLE